MGTLIKPTKMKTFKILAILGTMCFFGILGVTTITSKWENQAKTEAPQIKTTTSNHYLMPSIFPQVRR